ncbi:hypothetical protein FQR65_LT01448 [Abscondita terminalis]|nr:hypothetical protein FQR65_LT01448 [Abscondita terminalis]
MQSWCQLSTLYKGILTLVLGLIVVQYLFGSFIDIRLRENLVAPFNSSRHLNEKKLNHQIVLPFINATGSTNVTNVMSAETFSTNSTALSNNSLENDEEELVTNNQLLTTVMPLCPEVPANLTGRLKIVKSPVPTVLELEKQFSWLKPGGHWNPDTCRVLKKVAIIIPFRCRGEHLLIFLQHMHPLLRKQQIDYTIFVVEQEGNGAFNRAMLMNIGYKEALNLDNYDCFIFHDIDLLPEDDRNLYTCPEQPRHMSVAVDIFKYKLPYKSIFGGVSAISKEHFELLNGFSNSFWGWGGEDDDMSNRIRYHKLHISRYPISIARYTMLQHKKDKPSPHRYEVLRTGQKRFDKDGINSLKYTVKDIKKNLLYTWLLVKLEASS